MPLVLEPGCQYSAGGQSPGHSVALKLCSPVGCSWLDGVTAAGASVRLAINPEQRCFVFF